MLGVGWTEMMVIGVVALIVIGPKDLPAVMQKIGRFAGVIRRMGSDFQRELNKTTGLDEVRNLRNSITAPLKATTDAIRKEFNTTTANGTVQPSGALKPADPKAESVVNEIHAAAGIKPEPLPLTPEAAMERAVREKLAETEAAAAAAAPVAAATPAKAKRAKPATKTPATATPETVKPTPKSAARKVVAKVESPAPVEAIAPAKPVAKPKKTAAAASKPTAAPTPAAKPKAGAAPAAARPKARAKVAAVAAAAEPVAEAPKPAPKTPRRKPAAAKA